MLQETHSNPKIVKNRENNGKANLSGIQARKQIFQIINIYGPTTLSLRNTFFKHLKNYTKNQNNFILVDDFNMVEDLLLDRKRGNPSKSHQIGIYYLQQINPKRIRYVAKQKPRFITIYLS